MSTDSAGMNTEVWYCESHPEHEMGHDGCHGAGILECARVPLLANYLRLAKQEIREVDRFRDDVVAVATARTAELQQALDFLAGLHPCLTTDEPMVMAQSIFDTVQGQAAEQRRQLESAQRTIDSLLARRGSSTTTP
jgi:hypothetical protein